MSTLMSQSSLQTRPAVTRFKKIHSRVLSILLVACLVPALCLGAQPFYLPAALPLPLANFVTIGDLNRDGTSDLVVAQGGSVSTVPGSIVKVLLGHGDGSFGPSVSFGAGTAPTFVSLADLNGDGFPDLAVANGGSPYVTVYLSTGLSLSSYAGPFTWYCGSGQRSVAAGDLNGDGRPDLVVTNYSANLLTILFNSGGGRFTGTPLQLAAGSGPDVVGLADFNGDGKLDIAVSNDQSGSVSEWLGNGDGTFQPRVDYATSGGANWLVAGDVNKDGSIDLVTASFDGNVTEAVSVLLGRGDGTFQQYRNVYVSIGSNRGAFGLSMGDLNGDGNPDLAFTNDGSGTATVLLGNGDGTFGAPAAYATGRQPLGIAIGDVNGDGRPDLVAANTISGTASISLGNGDGTFGGRMAISGASPLAIATGDVNRDGRLDVATANSGAQSVSVLLGNGDGTLGTRTDLAVGPHPVTVALADLNLDGYADVVAGSDSTNDVSIYLSRGDGTFTSAPDVLSASGVTAVAVGDLNSDGLPDLAITSAGNGTVSTFLGKGDGTFKGKSSYGTGKNPMGVAIHDMNGDGKPDLVVANSDDNTVSVLLGTGNGGFKDRKNYPTGSVGAQSPLIADFNGDGIPDVAVASPSTGNTLTLGAVVTLMGNGDGSLGPASLRVVGFGNSPPYFYHSPFISSPNTLAAADLDGDGKMDIIAACANGTLISLQGHGDGTFGDGVTLGAAGIDYSLAVGDLNGDGRPDLVATSLRYPGISTYLNRGNGAMALATKEFAGRSEVAATPFVGVHVSPNPFNPETVLSFSLSRPGRAAIRVFDLQGRLVASPLHEATLSEGEHRVHLSGSALSSGVYFYRVETEEGNVVGRLTVLK